MGFWRAVMAGAVGLGCLLAAPAAERPEAEGYALAWPVLSRQLAAKQYPELVAGVEQYLRQYPLDSYHQRRIVGLVGSVFSLAWTQPEALESTARRILKEFPEVANYYTLAAERLAWNYLLNPQRKPDFAAAEEICRSALSHLGANLSPALVYAQQLLIWRHHWER
ncbi:MAG: hypothetical protein HUU35_07935 [Armatimonadetes bacterium]|nr:hypothetical protein [Armatimonadota bacterium]